MILLTRPAAESARLAALLRQQGRPCRIAPLQEITLLPVSLARADALLITSPAAARALARSALPRAQRCYAVGDKTADLLRQAGFRPVLSARGNSTDLLRLICNRQAKGSRLIHYTSAAAGLDLAQQLRRAGFRIRRRMCYHLRPSSRWPTAICQAIRSGKITTIPLYSPGAARHLCRLWRRYRLDPLAPSITLWCLSPAVARAASGLRWRAVRVARRPNEQDLLRAS